MTKIKPEVQFRNDLKKVAGLMKCRIDIFYDFFVPDAVKRHPLMRQLWIKKFVFWVIKVIRESQRTQPFDCILTTPTAVFCIELKCNNDKQKPHQKQREQGLNHINPKAYYVIRRWESKKRCSPLYETKYDIKQNDKVIFRTNYLPEIVEFFTLL